MASIKLNVIGDENGRIKTVHGKFTESQSLAITVGDCLFTNLAFLLSVLSIIDL